MKEEIKCPHCGAFFTVNESQYNEILAQVKTKQFDEELHERLAAELEKSALEHENKAQKVLTEKEVKITELQAQLDKIDGEKAQELAVRLAEKENVVVKLETELQAKSKEQEFAVDAAKKNQELEIQALTAKIDQLRLEAESKQKDAVRAIEIDRDGVKNQLIIQESQQKLEVESIKKDYERQLSAKDEEVQFYKDFKAQQSTKAIGESLENYCETEFNKLRSTAFQTAYFEKDNKVSKTSGSKGDFIFRDFVDETEYVSIMFEMKNEADKTTTKHRNRDFFKELDKDRTEKNCEYAVLVSMLEAEDEYYNTGIVEVFEYPKMYVVRPQFFIQIISLIRNAAKNSLDYRKELESIRQQNLDVTNFSLAMDDFRESFLKTSKNFNGNLDNLDKQLENSINNLTKARDELRKARKNLGTADNKITNDFTMKKFTKNSPSLRKEIE